MEASHRRAAAEGQTFECRESSSRRGSGQRAVLCPLSFTRLLHAPPFARDEGTLVNRRHTVGLTPWIPKF